MQLTKGEIMKIKYLRLTLILFLVFTLSCNQSNEPKEVDEVRIVFGKSIDDIEIGDNVEKVISILSQPDEEIMGDFVGYMYFYKTGKYCGITITFNDNDEVRTIQVDKTYTGFSKEGIGINSKRENVLMLFGNPNQVISKEDIYQMDEYLFGENILLISYTESKLTALVLYKPM